MVGPVISSPGTWDGPTVSPLSSPSLGCTTGWSRSKREKTPSGWSLQPDLEKSLYEAVLFFSLYRCTAELIGTLGRALTSLSSFLGPAICSLVYRLTDSVHWEARNLVFLVFQPSFRTEWLLDVLSAGASWWNSLDGRGTGR